MSAKRIKTDSQAPSARQEKRDQNHTVEKQSVKIGGQFTDINH
ncbi:hypothetical protein [Proteus mirabilis]